MKHFLERTLAGILSGFERYHPLLIPFVLAACRIETVIRFHGYSPAMLSSDIAYFGVGFYVWAITIHSSKLRLTPDPFSPEAEIGLIVVLLLMTFGWSWFVYPMPGETISRYLTGL
ncbi:MAG: hypothetical protein ABR910_03805 [Acidobacteriaceae bacterium]|jgi:hypothetical protein